MEEVGIIERSQSPWGMPVTIVPKMVPDGTLIPRPCIDARDINKLTKRDAFQLPRIDDILTMMESKSKYFSTLDLFSDQNDTKSKGKMQYRHRTWTVQLQSNDIQISRCPGNLPKSDIRNSSTTDW